MNSEPRVRLLARLVLLAFVVTFLAARILVLLIMTHRLPDLYLHLGGTHVHHLNYGIFLLSAVGAYLLFVRPTGGYEEFAAGVYGIGLALTFDEFGMWLHLGGPYWQRASFDAVVIIAALLGLIAYAPQMASFSLRHGAAVAVVLSLVAVFTYLSAPEFRKAARHLGIELRIIEAESPP
ncbi:MAG: hypothetical protein U0872_02530 [Planctomycetaceae bacterium]